VSDNAVTIRIGADIGEALDAFKDLSAAALNTNEAAVGAWKTDPFGPVTRSAEKFSASLDKVLSANLWSGAMSGASVAAERFAAYTKSMEARAQQMAKAMGVYGAEAGDALLKGLSGKAAQVANELAKVYGADAKAAFTAKLGQMGRDSGDALLTGLAASLGTRAEAATVPLLSAFEGLGRRMETVFDPLFRGMVTGIGAVVAAIAGIGTAAVTAGSEFEARMARVGAVTQATAGEMESMEAAALEIGKTLPVSGRESAEGMEALGASGMTAATVLGSVRAVALLATGQQMAMGAASDLVAAALVNFSLSAAESEHVVDVFTTAANESLLTIDKMAVALPYAANAAHAVGMSFEETSAAMMVLANSGLRGEQVGTGLRGVLRDLYNASGPAAKALKELGVSIYDTAGKARPLFDILKDLKEAGLDATSVFRIADSEAAAAMLALSRGADKLDALVEALKRTGTASEMANRMLGTLRGQWTLFANSLERTRIDIFDQMRQSLLGLVSGGMTPAMAALDEWVKSTRVAELAVTGFMEGLRVGTGDLDSFQRALDAVDPQVVGERFKTIGAELRTFFDALKEIASWSLWGVLLDHLEGVAAAITIGWAAAKILAVANGLIQFADSIKKMVSALNDADLSFATSPVAVAILAIGTAAAIAAPALLRWAGAAEEAAAAEAQAREMEQYALDYALAVTGEAEALDRLPPRLKRLAEAELERAGLVQETITVDGKAIKVYREKSSALDQLQASLKGVIEKNAELNEQERGGGSGAPTAMDAVLAALKKVSAGYESLTREASGAMTSLGLSAEGAGKSIETSLKEQIQDAAAEIDKGFGAAASRAFLEKATAMFSAYGGSAANAVKGLVETTREGTVNLLSVGEARLSGLQERYRTGLNSFGSDLYAFLDDALVRYEDADTAILATYDRFAKKIAALPAGGQEALKKMFASAPPEVQKALEKVLALTKSASDSVAQTFSAAVEGLTQAVTPQLQRWTSDLERIIRAYGENSAQAVAAYINSQTAALSATDSTLIQAAAKRDADLRAAKDAYDTWLREHATATAADIDEQNALLAAKQAEIGAAYKKTVEEQTEAARKQLIALGENLMTASQQGASGLGQIGDAGKTAGQTAGEGIVSGVTGGVQSGVAAAQAGGGQLGAALVSGIQGAGIAQSIVAAFQAAFSSAAASAKAAAVAIESAIRAVIEGSRIKSVLGEQFLIPTAPITTRYAQLMSALIAQSRTAGAQAGAAYAAAFAAAAGSVSGGSGGSGGGDGGDVGTTGKAASVARSVVSAAKAAGLV